jgi:hypothetical protein
MLRPTAAASEAMSALGLMWGSFGLQGLVGVVADVVMGSVDVGGVGGVDVRLVRRLEWWRVLADGVVTRERSLRHALPQGHGS